jgi:hypothetical protein
VIVIASEAKQSSQEFWIASSLRLRRMLLAMTVEG